VNRAYDSDDDLHELRDRGGRDREISLGTSTILGIFLALALICAAFFGFGYSLGRRSAQPTPPPADTTSDSSFSNFKPSPGSSAAPRSTSASSKESLDTAATRTVSVDPDDQVAAPTSKAVASDFMPAPPVESAKPVLKPAASVRPTPAAIPTAPSPTSAGVAPVVVQVAAVSHQEDANMLLAALKKKGYSVSIRQEPQDKLLHLQLGPFASKKEADAMRQRLLADGYNAIVK
jgi:DedD protein